MVISDIGEERFWKYFQDATCVTALTGMAVIMMASTANIASNFLNEFFIKLYFPYRSVIMDQLFEIESDINDLFGFKVIELENKLIISLSRARFKGID